MISKMPATLPPNRRYNRGQRAALDIATGLAYLHSWWVLAGMRLCNTGASALERVLVRRKMLLQSTRQQPPCPTGTASPVTAHHAAACCTWT